MPGLDIFLKSFKFTTVPGSLSSPNFNSYSRTCQSNMARQPILITDEEKERIDKKHPGSYTHSIRYGSDSKKKYNYICPRYWCLKTNMSISEEDVKNGVCGGPDAIIPRGSRVVPPGKSIYEFNARKEHIDERDGSYIKHHPGFLAKNKLTGDCLPCCFKRWDSASQIQRRKECLKEEESVKEKKKADDLDEYIKINTLATLNLARQAMQSGVKRFVFISSVKVLGDNTEVGKPFT